MVADELSATVAYGFRRRDPDPQRCVLLVIDMQQSFRGMAIGMMDRVNHLIQACRRVGIPIIFTRHGHRDPQQDGGMLAQWWNDLIVVGTPDWKLMEELDTQPNDVIIDKNRYSAFAGTNLEQMLHNIGRDELIITGVMTNCCCETTARDGFVRDFRIFFATDGTATVNEDLHLASLKTLAFGFAYLASIESLIASFNQK